MAEEEAEEEDTPAVELGSGPTVEGAPLGRVASRLSWPRARSDVIAREGETTIRTADGPIPLVDILDDVETTYFGTRREFVRVVRDKIGFGPVQSAE